MLKTIGRLVVSEKPLQFFGLLGAALALLAVMLAAPILIEYGHTGFVRRFPTLGLVTALVVCGGISFVTGLILSLIHILHIPLGRCCVPGHLHWCCLP